MKKGLYISNNDMTNYASGVTKKIIMQINAMKKEEIRIEAPNLYLNSVKDKFFRIIPFKRSYFDVELNSLLSREMRNGLDFVYIRHSICNIYLIRQLQILKNNGVMIVYEFPTFPYDRNSKRISGFLYLLKDKYSRKKLHNYVDIGVNYSSYDKIFRIDCIPISNGIDIEQISIKKVVNKKQRKIVFIGVGLLAYWNGYDRLIKAIAKYNHSKVKKYDLIFHIVGDGNYYNSLKRLVDKLSLHDSVFLHGFLSGFQLDELYNESDVGIGTLAPYRKYQDHIMSTLKTKEYAAKGIPFIKADKDIVFDKYHLDFIFNVPDDNTELNLESIISWYEKIMCSFSTEELTDNIRTFAKENLSWQQQLAPVIDRIKEEI